jgi:hypothetical protein
VIHDSRRILQYLDWAYEAENEEASGSEGGGSTIRVNE